LYKKEGLNVREIHFIDNQDCIGMTFLLLNVNGNYTRENAQVVTGLQTSCYKSVHKLSTSCVHTACSQLL
jgi:hypothetical protein